MFNINNKVLNISRGNGHSRVKVFTISAVADAVSQITDVAVWIYHNVAQIVLKLFIFSYNI
jgi:hypothetical protein